MFLWVSLHPGTKMAILGERCDHMELESEWAVTEANYGPCWLFHILNRFSIVSLIVSEPYIAYHIKLHLKTVTICMKQPKCMQSVNFHTSDPILLAATYPDNTTLLPACLTHDVDTFWITSPSFPSFCSSLTIILDLISVLSIRRNLSQNWTLHPAKNYAIIPFSCLSWFSRSFGFANPTEINHKKMFTLNLSWNNDEQLNCYQISNY